MTASGANGNGSPARSGTRALSLLAKPLNGAILHALAGGPTRSVDLRRECGSPAQTTLRAHLRELEGLGAIAKQRRNRFPGALEYELELAGVELLFVLEALQRWLEQAPERPLTFGTSDAKAAIKALVDSWSTTMLRALAAQPLSLTELDGVIGSLSYPSLERRLGAMRLAGQVEVCESNGPGTPYRVTEWLRRGVAPLAAAARWERRHAPSETVPITRIDTEAAFLLAVPLLHLHLPSDISGSCRMAAEFPNGKKERRLAGVVVDLEEGRIKACATRLQGNPQAWALGSPGAWLSAVIENDLDRLELGGDGNLARTLLESLHHGLFGAVASKPSP